MSKIVRTELIYIPAKFERVEHVTYVYSCRNCEKNGIATPIINATSPNALIKGSIASASVVSGIINGKYVNGLPLYRQEKEFKRNGIFISRQNMANWIIRCAQDYFHPLYERMRKELLKQDILHADETTTQVLKEPGRKPTSTSYMWLYRTKQTDRSVVLFEYQQTRQAKHPKNFLSGFKGYLHVDGYSSYHSLPIDITIVGCWSHSRRRFEEALKVIPEKDRAGTKSQEGLDFCNKLFAVEREIKNLANDEKLQARKDKIQPILDEFHKWLIKTQQETLPKTKIGEAISYTLAQWQYLQNYMLDARLEISNNLAERSLRTFVIGRKNSLFSDTPNGAFASAVIYSLVETAKENNLKPYEYIKYILTKMPNMDLKENPNALEDLLPWSALIPEEFKMPVEQAKP